MKKIAIIGFGVVGSGVYEIVRKNKQVLTKKAGEEIDIKKVLDIRDFSDHEESGLFTKDFNDILNDPEISIVVETMGGIKFAYDYTKAALSAGKSVVTSNKELVAAHGDEFFYNLLFVSIGERNPHTARIFDSLYVRFGYV
jgi:homoserine dehydrogenase